MRRCFYSFILISTLFVVSCSSADCPLPEPFCGTSFDLNLQQTTEYGPAWADIVTGSSDWITCFGPYALCYYADCTPTEGSDGSVADCSCYQAYGINFVDINAILNEDVYNETRAFCDADPEACKEPNQAPVCQSLISGDFMEGAVTFSTFSFYRSTIEPIGMTDCSEDPQLYAGCMTAPCFGDSTEHDDGTTTIQCQCPTYDGPFQVGLNDLTCEQSSLIYSAAYNVGEPTPPENKCDIIGTQCIPDASEENCGCPLLNEDTSIWPTLSSDVDCDVVCEEYDSCERSSTDVEVGYTCDATICTSNDQAIIADACLGLQNCDLSEIYKAELEAGCSCCASQLCNCEASSETEAKIGSLVTEQRDAGETPQCDVNGTLCGD